LCTGSVLTADFTAEIKNKLIMFLFLETFGIEFQQLAINSTRSEFFAVECG